MAALPLTDKISQQSERSTKFRTKYTQFGDGYSQRAPDGLNSKVDKWNIIWENLTNAESDSITSVLDSVGSSDILTWTPFGEIVEKKFIIDVATGYSFNPFSGSLFTVSTSLTQVFDI